MTLLNKLLVLIAERLFKLGEHWQLDHRLEVLFRRVKHYSLLTTVLMTAAAAAVVYVIQRLLQGQLFNVPLLVFWILLGLLCIGAGKVRLHKTRYVYSGRFIMPINASTSFSSEPRITQPNPNEYAAVSMACRASTASFCACVNR